MKINNTELKSITIIFDLIIYINEIFYNNISIKIYSNLFKNCYSFNLYFDNEIKQIILIF